MHSLGAEDIKHIIIACGIRQSIVRDIHVSKSLEYKLRNAIDLSNNCKITKEKSTV